MLLMNGQKKTLIKEIYKKMEIKGIRLTDFQKTAICEDFAKVFFKEDHLWLFGSRADLNKRGGDIDLYVETNLTIDEVLQAKLDFARELFFRLDDQKIDIVIKYQGADDLLIYNQAKETGVQLL